MSRRAAGSDDEWSQNRAELHAKMHVYSTDMSELSRLFQLVVLKGNESDQAKLKAVLADTNARLSEMFEEIESHKAILDSKNSNDSAHS